ncbi:MAG: tRNA (cytidine(34)-2'-O)-methyltransferase [Rhodobacteraceae bacterium]|nr:tRNA (cytidine(34)-2'-O)-methyltransferase [Paracoccaceae bacterium]
MRLAAYEPDIALNVGAMLRLCAGFDLGFDVIEPCGFPFSIKAVRRSAMDYAELVDIRRHTSWTAFQSARAEATDSGRLVLLTTRGARSYLDLEYQSGDVLLVGRESAGVPEHVHEAVDARVVIPMAPGARSLNVAMAAAVVTAEARRQLNVQ